MGRDGTVFRGGAAPFEHGPVVQLGRPAGKGRCGMAVDRPVPTTSTQVRTVYLGVVFGEESPGKRPARIS